MFFHYSEILDTIVKIELQDEVEFTVMQVCTGMFFHYSEILDTSVKTKLQDEVEFTVMQVCSSTTVRY